jgi:hypothetical protein
MFSRAQPLLGAWRRPCALFIPIRIRKGIGEIPNSDEISEIAAFAPLLILDINYGSARSLWRYLGEVIMKQGIARVALLVGAATAMASQSASAIMLKVPEAELIKKSNSIVIGRVIGERCYWNEQGTLILTDYTIQISQCIKGDAKEAVSNVTVVGGRIGEIGLVVSDVPIMSPGEEVLLYLEKRGDGRIGVKHGAQGKCTITNDVIKESGESVRSYIARANNSLEIEK